MGTWVKLDLVEGSGVESAVDGVDLVIHAATAPQGDTEAVDVGGTKRLLKAAEAAGVEHFVYPSIVGTDDIPYTYYSHKRTAENAVEESDIPTTIVRATQFHSFIAEMLGYVSKLPVWPLPTRLQIQPVDVREVAAVIVTRVILTPAGRIDPIGGPQVHSVGELARAYREARGMRRRIVRFPLPGETVAAFRAGSATCPDHSTGTVTWRDWLAEQYGTKHDATISRVLSTV